jgi:hypothetical protein
VGEGLISETELAAALAAQEENGKLLGEILVDSGVVSRIAIARVLALQWGVTLEEERGYGYGLRGELERRKLPHDAPHPSEAEPAESASADGDGASSAEASVGPVGSDVPLAEPELAADEVRLTQPSSQRSERLLDRLAEQEALLGREEAVALQEHERRLKAQQQTAADIGRTLAERHRQLEAAGLALGGGATELERALAETHLVLAQLAQHKTESERLSTEAGDQQDRLRAADRGLSVRRQQLEELEARLELQQRFSEEQAASLLELEQMQRRQLREHDALASALREREKQIDVLEAQLSAQESAVTRTQMLVTDFLALETDLDNCRLLLDQLALLIHARADATAAPTTPGDDRFPYVDLGQREIDYGVARFFPEPAARHYEALPISLENGLVTVALAQRDESRVVAVRRLLAREANFVRVDRPLLLKAINDAYASAAQDLNT